MSMLTLRSTFCWAINHAFHSTAFYTIYFSTLYIFKSPDSLLYPNREGNAPMTDPMIELMTDPMKNFMTDPMNNSMADPMTNLNVGPINTPLLPTRYHNCVVKFWKTNNRKTIQILVECRRRSLMSWPVHLRLSALMTHFGILPPPCFSFPFANCWLFFQKLFCPSIYFTK